jgi:molecular chaperone DnaJ
VKGRWFDVVMTCAKKGGAFAWRASSARSVNVTVHQRQGFFSIQQTCPQCRGTGKHIPEPCATCNGAGRVKTHKTLEVKIPAGINEGMRIRSTGRSS